MKSLKSQGVTLPEILIALAVVATLATFTVPKILENTHNNKSEDWNRAIKLGVAEVEAAYVQYRLENRTVPTNFHLDDATQYLNYIKRDTTSLIDGTPCFGYSIDCSSATSRCYLLKNGSMLHIFPNEHFGGSGNLNAMKWRIDPDGEVTGPIGDDEGKAVVFYTYYVSGKIRARTQIDSNTIGNSYGPESASSACDPNWWSWD